MGRRKKSDAAANVAIPTDRMQLIGSWYAAKNAADQADANEFALRNSVIAVAFDPNKLSGSETIDIGNGYKLQAVKIQGITATNQNGETVALLQLVAQHLGNDTAAALISWQPIVSVSTYKSMLAKAQLVPELNEALSKAITLKPGSPQLKLIEPETQSQ
jgi:hypothetical protein